MLMDEQRLLDAVLLENPGTEKFVPEPQDISVHSLYESAILQYNSLVVVVKTGVQKGDKR